MSDASKPSAAAGSAGEPVSREHKLQHAWSIYENRQRKTHTATGELYKEKWADKQLRLCDVETVEQFWACWVHVPKPSELFLWKNASRGPCVIERIDETGEKDLAGKPAMRRTGVEELEVFRADRAPRAEFELSDGTRPNRYRLMYRTSDLAGFSVTFWDLVWKYLVLAVVGGTMDPDHHVCGVLIGDKGSPPKSAGAKVSFAWRLEIWLDTEDIDVVQEIKTQFQKIVIPHVLNDVADNFDRNIMDAERKAKSIMWSEKSLQKAGR